MNEHLNEEQLILHYYGEGLANSVPAHLDECAECRQQYRTLQLVLNTVESPVPEPSAHYEDAVWNRLAPRLGRKRRLVWWGPRTWAPVAAVAAMLVVAFLAGRYSQPGKPPGIAQAPAAAPARERILMVAVGDHLERSHMVLAEIVNVRPAKQLDIAPTRELAKGLVDANRLYRQTAVDAGDAGTASLLDDLERVLLDVANSPDTVPGAELDLLRRRIEAQGLLFKMRVVSSI